MYVLKWQIVDNRQGYCPIVQRLSNTWNNDSINTSLHTSLWYPFCRFCIYLTVISLRRGELKHINQTVSSSISHSVNQSVSRSQSVSKSFVSQWVSQSTNANCENPISAPGRSHPYRAKHPGGGLFVYSWHHVTAASAFAPAMRLKHMSVSQSNLTVSYIVSQTFSQSVNEISHQLVWRSPKLIDSIREFQPRKFFIFTVASWARRRETDSEFKRITFFFSYIFWDFDRYIHIFNCQQIGRAYALEAWTALH